MEMISILEGGKRLDNKQIAAGGGEMHWHEEVQGTQVVVHTGTIKQ